MRYCCPWTDPQIKVNIESDLTMFGDGDFVQSDLFRNTFDIPESYLLAPVDDKGFEIFNFGLSELYLECTNILNKVIDNHIFHLFIIETSLIVIFFLKYYFLQYLT